MANVEIIFFDLSVIVFKGGVRITQVFLSLIRRVCIWCRFILFTSLEVQETYDSLRTASENAVGAMNVAKNGEWTEKTVSDPDTDFNGRMCASEALAKVS